MFAPVGAQGHIDAGRAGGENGVLRAGGGIDQGAESLELVAAIRKNAAEAAKMEPFKATEVPEADRTKLIEGYKAKMAEFNQAVDKLEAAFKAGNNEEAAKLV